MPTSPYTATTPAINPLKLGLVTLLSVSLTNLSAQLLTFFAGTILISLRCFADNYYRNRQG